MEAPPKPNFLYDLVLPKVEWIGWPLAVLGLGLHWAGLSGGPIVLLISLSTLALLFFLRAYEPIASGDILAINTSYVPVVQPSDVDFFLVAIAPKVQNIAGAVTLIGILFKLLFWKGSAALLLVGVSALVPVAVWQLATKRLRWRVAVVTALGLATWLVPTETLVRQFYRDDPALVAKMLYQAQHPHDRAAAQEVRRLMQARYQRLRSH